LTLINLIYSLSEGSNFRIQQAKSAFRNRLYAHERAVYRRLLRIIGFESSLFNSVHSPVAVCKDPSVPVYSSLIAQKSHNGLFQKSCSSPSTGMSCNETSLISDRTSPSLTAALLI